MVNTKSQKNVPSKFNIAGHHTNNSHDIANVFNNYFTQVCPSLNRQIPQANTNYGVHLTNHNENSIFLNSVTKTEICNIVCKFKNNKSAGTNGIKPGLIKSVITYISDPLCQIFNLSLSNGVFPNKLKVAKVTPIFKSGDPAELHVSNDIPISVLSIYDSWKACV